MKKKIGIILSVVFIALLISTISVYAYIRSSAGNKDINGSSTITTNNVIEVASFTELFTNGTDTIYNNKDNISATSTRKVLKLTADITLSSDLVLTKDIQIDLNNHTLNLNNYVLTFKHGYAGTSGIYKGTVETGLVTTGESKGQIVVDLVKSGFIANNITYKKNNVGSNEANVITIISIDEKYTAYSALYMVGKALNSSLNKNPVFEDYLTVSDNTFALTVDKFLPSIFCKTSNSTEYCAYVYKDLDLPFYYLSSNIQITYSSTNPTALSNRGNVEITDNATNVTLTATVSSTDFASDYSVSFNLHLVKIADAATKAVVAKTLIESYLAPYYHNEPLILQEEEVFDTYYYGFPHAIDLPKSAFDGTITYAYSVTDYSNSPVLGRITDGSVAYFEPSSSCYHLIINGDSYNMYSTYVSTKESAAYLILNHLYGGAIIYDKTYNELALQTVSTINVGTNTVVKNLLTEHGVSAINYQIKASSDAETYYSITNNVLTINTGVVPPDKSEYITVTFTFSDTTTVSIDVYVEYLDSTGSILSSFLTYYNIYDPTVPSEMMTTFTMPFAYNDSATATPHLIAPYIVYDVATYTKSTLDIGGGNTMEYYNITYNKPINLKIELYYNGQSRYTFPMYTTQSSFTNQLDQYLSSSGQTLTSIGSYSDAKYIFSINAKESLTENQKLILIYNYKFNASDATWTRYANRISNTEYLTDLNTTMFTVLGGLFYSANGKTASGTTVLHAVRDTTFFKWIYNKFKPSQVEAIDTFDENTTIIPIDWLSQDVLISSSDTALASVNDYSGIGYLKNVTTVDLSNGNVSEEVITGLAGMPSLTTLILKNCGITDISALSSLTTVKVLDISDNSIDYFDALSDVTCLEKVYLYNNVPEDETAQKYIGSTGICNFQAFQDLMRNGCAVYNIVSNNIPVLYAESNSIDDFRRLKAICYQDKLKTGLDITDLYQGFYNIGTNITTVTGNARPGNNPFGLQTAGTLSWGYEADKTVGEATYFYCKLTYSGSNYVLTVKYYVDRY